jgi:hypothetical protein
MRIAICFSLTLLGFVAGCGDHAGKPPEPTNSASVLSAPADYVGAMGKAQQSAVKTVDTAVVKQAVQLFQAVEGRLPKDLNEVVEKKYLPRIPEAPAGARIDYDPATGEVKVVKQ